MKVDKQDIIKCADKGYSFAQTADKLGVTIPTITYHARQMGLSDEFAANKFKTRSRAAHKVLVTSENGFEKQFPSKVDAAKHLDITPSALTYRLDSGEFINGFKIDTLKKEAKVRKSRTLKPDTCEKEVVSDFILIKNKKIKKWNKKIKEVFEGIDEALVKSYFSKNKVYSHTG